LLSGNDCVEGKRETVNDSIWGYVYGQCFVGI
jgi:hypothetical protein